MSENEKILIARIEERLKSFEDKIDDVITEVGGMEKRMNAFDRWKMYMTGGGVVMVAITGVIVNVLISIYTS
jgi:hypothetical protein